MLFISLSKKISFLSPITVLIFQVLFNLNVDIIPTINPSSSKNDTIDNFTELLAIAKIHPIKKEIRDYQDEIEYHFESPIGTTYPVIFSTTLSEIDQVAALQKVTKAANIKGQVITLVDLSTVRPYATLKNN